MGFVLEYYLWDKQVEEKDLYVQVLRWELGWQSGYMEYRRSTT